jgi:hypothetical protein
MTHQRFSSGQPNLTVTRMQCRKDQGSTLSVQAGGTPRSWTGSTAPSGSSICFKCRSAQALKWGDCQLCNIKYVKSMESRLMLYAVSRVGDIRPTPYSVHEGVRLSF